jgi:hypothetical protein
MIEDCVPDDRFACYGVGMLLGGKTTEELPAFPHRLFDQVEKELNLRPLIRQTGARRPACR